MSVGEARMAMAPFILEFVRDLLSNFCADLCAGLVLALLAAGLAYMVGKKLHIIELAQQQKERDQIAIQRAIRYLHLLQVREIGPLVRDIPDWLERIGQEFQIQTPLWFGVVGQGEELAGVVSPVLLSDLATFYQGLVYAKRGVNFLMAGWTGRAQTNGDRVHELFRWQVRFNDMMKEGLSQAAAAGEGLTAKIESEIDRLKADLTDAGLPASEMTKLEEELEAIQSPSG